MTLTNSTMLPLGSPAPEFDLPNVVGGEQVRLSDFIGKKALLVMFICNHCPYVIHLADELMELGMEYQRKGCGVVAISSNNIEMHPDDSPEKMKEEVAKRGYTFPYCYDESQEVAKAYRAACTPDFFVFNHDHKLFYRGRLDGSRPGSDTPVTGHDLRHALDAAIAGKEPPAVQQPSMGCNIKWKAGNAPDYFDG